MAAQGPGHLDTTFGNATRRNRNDLKLRCSITPEPRERLLLGPGPSNVSPRGILAMTLPLMGYLNPTFLKVMDEAVELLRQVFRI